jgi:septum formation protein
MATSNNIYLASRSPRRRELLRQIGVKHEILVLRLGMNRGTDVDESIRPGESAEDYVLRIARDKADAGQRVLSMRAVLPRPVLAADTTVVVDGKVLGKPGSPTEAASFLRQLSGRTHEVRTAVGLAVYGHVHTAVSVSRVTFRALTDTEVERYCHTGEPNDKAGGYAIQGVAAIFIERIEGSYSGVMGLPLYETAQLLARAGIQVL